jgi:hypothetical protein
VNSNWQKLPPIKGSSACLTCGCGSHDTLGMDSILAVGFGSVTVTKGGECIYSEPQGGDLKEEDFWNAKRAEDEALKDPDHDWRIHFYAPLYEAEYQRQGEGHAHTLRCALIGPAGISGENRNDGRKSRKPNRSHRHLTPSPQRASKTGIQSPLRVVLPRSWWLWIF